MVLRQGRFIEQHFLTANINSCTLDHKPFAFYFSRELSKEAGILDVHHREYRIHSCQRQFFDYACPYLVPHGSMRIKMVNILEIGHGRTRNRNVLP